ncbi:hypothetical protein CDAR_595351 [Caerostris darwini]|uniref:Uncharacterized protein n=1 Tax=Caerostris darwini TaxID=1538125 RepID=A0AAV4SM64_9ARAC|nr:hypothetical protein CDAR_595351 [Caerostris darwini]
MGVCVCPEMKSDVDLTLLSRSTVRAKCPTVECRMEGIPKNDHKSKTKLRTDPFKRGTQKVAKKTTPIKGKARTIPRCLMKDLDSITRFLSQRILMACHLTLNPSGIKPKLNSPKPLLRTQFINMPGVIDYGFNMKLEDKGINSPFIQKIPPLSKSR